MDHRATEAPELESGHPGSGRASPRKWMKLNLKPEQVDYFEARARIRRITFTALMRRLIDAVSKDQMVAAILDDASAAAKPRRYERRARKA